MKQESAGSARSPRHITQKGLSTRTALLEAAAGVFEESGFFSSSVSEITRRCGVSQGTFYQYFKNKEQVFLELNDLILASFWESVRALPREDGGFLPRLGQVLGLIIEHTRKNFYFHRILGEFELIDPVAIGYYDSLARYLRTFFRQAALAGDIRPIDPNVIAYGVLGMAYFHALDWGQGAEEYQPEKLVELSVDLLLKGIDGPSDYRKPARLNRSEQAPGENGGILPGQSQTQGESTRNAIYRAAEQIFGRQGYNRAGISEITRLAGIAQGTFYVHFESKQALMKGVVEYLSRAMRRELKISTDRVSDRRDMEREGMMAFFRFLKPHRNIYRVLAECETLGQELAMWYYRKLAKGYHETLSAGVAEKQIRALPVTFMVRALMGLNHMIGLKWLVWNSSPQAEFPPQLLEDAIDLVLFGFDPS